MTSAYLIYICKSLKKLKVKEVMNNVSLLSKIIVIKIVIEGYGIYFQ